MLRELHRYLVLNDHAAIPGVGTFTVENKPATFDGTTFHPPLQQLKFQAGTALTDKSFYRFLSQEKNISEVDAVRSFQDFAYQLRNNIQQQSSVELPGLGLLRKDHTGGIAFEPVALPAYFTSITPAERRSATDNEEAGRLTEEASFTEPIEETGEELVVKDRWWIWATVLAVLALAAIGYFYMQQSY